MRDRLDAYKQIGRDVLREPVNVARRCLAERTSRRGWPTEVRAEMQVCGAAATAGKVGLLSRMGHAGARALHTAA